MKDDPHRGRDARRAAMRRMLERCAAAVLLAPWAVLWPSGPAAANSDGYYCIGPNYLAYQFAFSNGVQRHQLAVVPLTHGFTIDEPVTVELPEFQVRGMRCNQTSVELRDDHAVYGVDIADREHAVLIGRKPLDPEMSYRFQRSNLGLWAFSGFQSNGAAALTVPLPSPGDDLAAALLLRVSELPGLTGAIRRHQTEIVIVNERTGRVNSRAIFEGSTRAGTE